MGQCQSSRTPSTVRDVTKLAASALCTFTNFILSKLYFHSAIAMASPSQHFTMNSFRLNWTFKLFDTHLLIERKLGCNLGRWNTSLMQTRLMLRLTMLSQRWIICQL